MSATETEVTRYRYEDEDGVLLYETIRYATLDEDGKLGKTFKQRAGNGTWSMKDVRRVPYRLPALLTAKAKGWPIVVVEGEKDVDRLAELGIVATTNAGGSGWAWTHEFAESFVDAPRVVVVADSDAPGRKAGNARCAMLAKIITDVRLLDLAPDRADGYDVSDYLFEHSKDDLIERLRNAPTYVPQGTAPALTDGIISLDDLLNAEAERAEWLIEGLIPSGGIALLSAKPKVGKSVLAQNLAIAIARGEQFLGRRCRQGPVLYLAMEERRETIAERLRALGATGNLPIHLRVGRADAQAMPWLIQAVAKIKPALVVIDTLVRLIRLEDIERYGATSNALEPLLHISRELGIAQLWLHHNNKSGDSTNSVSGSNAIVAAVDTTIIMRRGEDGTRSAFSEQRVGEDMEETVLRMNPNTFAISAAGSRAVAEQRSAEAKILELLSEPTSREDIAKLPGCRLYVGRRAAGALIDDGRLKLVSGTGGRGNPRLYAVDTSADLADEETPNQENTSSPGYIYSPDEETKKRIPRPEFGTRVDERDERDEADERDEETRTSEPCGFHRGNPYDDCDRCHRSFADHNRLVAT